MTAAAIDSPTSRPLTFLAAAALGAAGRTAGAGAGAAAEGGRCAGAPLAVGGRTETGAAPAAGGTGGRGAAAAAGGTPMAGAGGGGGPPAGSVGNLIVGEEVGLGGRLMRTVSFFGCTLAASGGLGGTAPAGLAGMFGLLSAIRLFVPGKLDLASIGVKLLFDDKKSGLGKTTPPAHEWNGGRS